METMAHRQQVSLSLPRCSYLFVLRHVARWHNRAHIVLNSSPQENAHLTIYHGASGRKKDPISRLHVGLTPTKLLLRLTEHLLAQHIFPSRPGFPVKHYLVLCKYKMYQSHR